MAQRERLAVKKDVPIRLRMEDWCSHEVRGGVCMKHGATKIKTCSFKGCTNKSKIGGV